MDVIDVAWLDQLADVAGAKVEVDQDGGVCVSPASDGHVIAATRLAVQLAAQIPADVEVLVEGPRWSPVRDAGPSYVPDLVVIAEDGAGPPGPGVLAFAAAVPGRGDPVAVYQSP